MNVPRVLSGPRDVTTLVVAERLSLPSPRCSKESEPLSQASAGHQKGWVHSFF